MEGEHLIIRPENLPFFPDEIRFPMDARSTVLERITPIDRLPELFPGKTWTTSSINPFALAPNGLGTGLLSTWFSGHSSTVTTEHRVVETELVIVDGHSYLCYRVDRRGPPSIRTSTWARISDGLVVQHQMVILGKRVTLSRVNVPRDTSPP